METILACHPARSTEWLDCHPKSCELWRIRTGPIDALKFVTPWWSTPEMSRMTAFHSSPRAAAWPTCSCISTYMKTAKCKTVAISGLGKRFFKTRWFCGWWMVETSRNHTLTSVFFFFLFSTMDYRKRHAPIATTIAGSSSLDLANARKWSFHSNFWRTITKNALFNLGITIFVRQVTPALLWKRKVIFKKYSSS